MKINILYLQFRKVENGKKRKVKYAAGRSTSLITISTMQTMLAETKRSTKQWECKITLGETENEFLFNDIHFHK